MQHFGLAANGGQLRAQFSGLRFVGGYGVLRTEGKALFDQLDDLAVAAEGEDAEAFGVAGNYIERTAVHFRCKTCSC